VTSESKAAFTTHCNISLLYVQSGLDSCFDTKSSNCIQINAEGQNRKVCPGQTLEKQIYSLFCTSASYPLHDYKHRPRCAEGDLAG